MMIGPEPMSRIFFRSVRFGMFRGPGPAAKSISPLHPIAVQSSSKGDGRRSAVPERASMERKAMRRSLGFVAAVVLLAGSAWGQVREGVALKLKRPAAGSAYTVERREEQSGAATIKGKGGKVEQPRGSRRILNYKFRETVVDQPDAGPPTVLERRYE